MAASNNVYARVAGVWQNCIPWVKVAGTWVPVQEGWTKIAGTWTQFYSAVVVALAGVNYYGTKVGSSCTVQYSLTSGGKEQYFDENSTSTPIGDWVIPNGSAAGYECRLTATTGTFSTGTMATWLALTSTRTWTVTQATVGVKQAIGTIEIRDATTLVVKATATVDLTAERA
jgi:hypothetical protein